MPRKNERKMSYNMSIGNTPSNRLKQGNEQRAYFLVTEKFHNYTSKHAIQQLRRKSEAQEKFSQQQKVLNQLHIPAKVTSTAQ